MAKIYLSNWSSQKTKGCHGPGRILSIAVLTPPSTEVEPPDGVIAFLTPRVVDLAEYEQGKIDLETYRERFFAKARGAVEPGKLMWQPYSFFERDNEKPVEDGDTLCCVCSKEKASRGECHRVWVMLGGR
jgi:hypothetical protein